MVVIRSRAPQLWSRSRALWGGVLQLQLALVLVSLALLAASSQGDEASSLLRGPTNAHATNYGEAQFTSALVASHAGLQTHRRLASATTNSTIDDATEKANEIGASVRDAIKQLRGGSEKFYKDLITAAKIMICQHKVDNPGTGVDPSNRYIDETDDLAYKNSTGGCIRITITAMSDDDMVAKYANANTCEVEPNCYWSAINTAVDTDRVPVYAMDRTVQPAEGSMTYSDAKDEFKKWGQGMLVFVVPGIILAVLSLLTMIFFLICRCCCNRCGSRSPKEGGYTCMQKFLPLLFFLLFAVGVVAVAGVSLLYQKTLTDAVDDTFNTTLSTLNDTGSWLVRIRTPLEEIRDKVADSADEIALQIADTSFIDNGIDGLTGALTKFKDDSADRTLPAGCKVTAGDPYCVACTVCTTISDQVGLANQQIKDNAGKGVAELKDVRDTLTTSLIKVKDTVRSNVADHVGDLDTFITTTTDTHKNVDDVYGTYDGQKAAQQAGVLVFFGLALVVIVLGLLGILFGLTPLKFLANIIHIAYFIGFLALILTFTVSSIFLAVSVVLGDACEMTAIISQNWTVVVSGQNGDIVNACFDKNASLIDALNLTSQLDFARGGIPFPDDIDTNKLLDFSDLDAFAETIKGVDSSTFQVDQATLDKGLDALNKYTKQTDGQCNPVDGNYVEATILTPWDANDGLHTTTNDGLTYMIDRYKAFEQSCLAGGPGLPFECDSATPCTFQAFVGELYKKASTLAAVKVDGAAFVTQFHQNMDAVTASTQTFKDKTKDLNDKVNVIKEDLEKSLFSYVGDFEKEMTCTFIQDSYLGIYSALCGDLMPAFTMISLMLFLAGIFLIPVTICLIIAVKRLKARGNGSHVMDNEMKFK